MSNHKNQRLSGYENLKPREAMMEVMQYMAKSGLTDYSGGNMALRIGDTVYSTRTHSADIYRWRLQPDTIIVTDIDGNVLEGEKEKLSREIDLHLRILKKIPQINATLHGNTFYSPLIVEAGIKEPAAVTQTAIVHNIGNIPVVPEAFDFMSEKEYEYVVETFEKRFSEQKALVIIMPLHGVMVAAKDHNDAFALLDALESNSKFIYEREMLRFALSSKKVFSAARTKPALYDLGTLKEQVITEKDIESICRKKSFKEILLDKDQVLTDMAKSRAKECGLKILYK